MIAFFIFVASQDKRVVCRIFVHNGTTLICLVKKLEGGGIWVKGGMSSSRRQKPCPQEGDKNQKNQVLERETKTGKTSSRYWL